MVKGRYIIFICFIVSLGGFLFGFDAAVIAGVNSFITPEFNLNDFQKGWLNSSVSLFAAISMLFSGVVSDKFGRKNVLIFVALLYSISALFSAFAPNFTSLVTARIIGSVAFGAALVLVPVYIAELVPAKYRGRMVTIQQLAIVLGFSAAYFSNYYIQQLSQESTEFVQKYALDKNAWRLMLGIESIPALVYFFLLFLVPRSPRWLLMKGKESEASSVLETVNAENEVPGILTDVKRNIDEAKNANKGKLADLLKPGMRLILLIGLVMAVAQMITGINAVFFYANNIFEQTGIGTDASFVQAIFVGLINVVFTLLALYFIDRLGRKPLLLAGLMGIAISLSIVSFGFSKATYTLSGPDISALNKEIDSSKLAQMKDVVYDSDVSFKNAIKASIGNQMATKYESAILQSAAKLNPMLILIGILGFVASFAFSLGPVMWVLFSEIFPNYIRGIAVAIFGFINSLTSFLVTQLFPWELSNLGNATTFAIYVGFALLAFVILYRILPETKGKTLEELEAILVK